MEIAQSYLEKFKPTERKAGEPRSERETMLLIFKNRLNKDRAKVNLAAFTDGYVATMFKGYPTGRLHELFNECSVAERFGGLLKFKLNEFRGKEL